MPALQVKDFPEELYDELRACATAEDRSISQQTIHVLREYLRAYRELGGRTGWVVSAGEAAPARHGERQRIAEEERAARIERKRKVFERIHALPKFDLPDDFPSAAEIVRQMREERDDQVVPELSWVR